MKAIRYSLALAAGLAAAPLSALAQSGDDALVILGARLPTQPVDATASVSILDEEDLARRQTVFLADALATLPGVSTAQNGAFGGQTSIRLRGALSEQTLVLIDGVPVNDPTSPGGGFNASALDSADISRVEVLRGPQSVLWGSDAIGGVVNIVTRASPEGWSGGAFAEAGSHGFARAGGSLAVGNARVQARLGGVLVGADGISKADEDDGATEEDRYDAATLDGRVRAQLTQSLSLEAFARHVDSETDYDGFGFVTGVADSDERDVSATFSGGATARLALFDGRFRNALTASRAELERNVYSSNVFSFGAEGSRDVYRYQGDVTALPGVDLSLGADHERTQVEGASDVEIDGLFLLAQAKPLSTLTLSGGVRRDEHSRFGDVTTHRLGALWRPTATFGLRASWGEGFKAPTIFQLTSSFGPLPPNAALQPEEAEGWDAALLFSLFNARLTGEIAYFDLNTENQIDFSFATLRYENIARVETNGVEASAAARISDHLTLRGAYTNTDARNGVSGAPLLRVPEHAAYLEADWQATPRLGLLTSLRYNGSEPDAFAPTGRNPSWTRLDLAGRYAATDAVELFARIENVADENYQDVFGYGTPGRSVYGGVRVRLP